MNGVCRSRAIRNLSLAAVVFLATAVAATAGDRYKFANEGTIGKDWTLAPGAKLAVPGYPESQALRADNVCLALGYAINPDGTTSDFSVLKSWSSGVGADGNEPVPGYWDAFSQASARAVSQWKFQPRETVTPSRATYTVTTVSFGGQEAMDPASLRGQCAIGDLADFVQNHKASNFMASSEKQDMENLDRQGEQRRLERMARALERPLGGQ